MGISIMTCIDNRGSGNFYVHCTGCNNGIFVSDSVGVGNSVVKIRSSKSVAVAKMGNNSRCSMSGSEDSRVGLTFLAAIVSISISVAIVSSISSIAIVSTIWVAI